MRSQPMNLPRSAWSFLAITYLTVFSFPNFFSLQLQVTKKKIMSKSFYWFNKYLIQFQHYIFSEYKVPENIAFELCLRFYTFNSAFSFRSCASESTQSNAKFKNYWYAIALSETLRNERTRPNLTNLTRNKVSSFNRSPDYRELSDQL